jgi:hypothetical protein
VQENRAASRDEHQFQLTHYLTQLSLSLNMTVHGAPLPSLLETSTYVFHVTGGKIKSKVKQFMEEEARN